MDPITLFKAAILGIVEGLTEFLPVSSTGHLILAEDLLRFSGEGREAFIVAIQSGAILAVIWEYRARLARLTRGLTTEPRERRLVLNVVVAFLPAAVLGVLLKDAIETALFHPVPVALALIGGGLAILVVEHLHARRDYHPRVATMDDMDWRDALKVGCAQCFALIPGTSRSGATIIGGLFFGLSRPAATEFSFFLALPTVIGASVYSLWQARAELSVALLPSFMVGSATAFVSALLCVRWLLRFVSRNDFRVFAWYRIAFGGVVLLTGWFGWVEWRA